MYVSARIRFLPRPPSFQQDWQIVKEYTDKASGKRGDRVQFQAMFEAASRREFDTVLFWSLDRLSREGVYEKLQHLQRLTSYGVNYKSYTEEYLDSCGIFRDAVIGILATVAKQERIRRALPMGTASSSKWPGILIALSPHLASALCW